MLRATHQVIAVGIQVGERLSLSFTWCSGEFEHEGPSIIPRHAKFMSIVNVGCCTTSAVQPSNRGVSGTINTMTGTTAGVDVIT